MEHHIPLIAQHGVLLFAKQEQVKSKHFVPTAGDRTGKAAVRYPISSFSTHCTITF
jgi:hypothetical protein